MVGTVFEYKSRLSPANHFIGIIIGVNKDDWRGDRFVVWKLYKNRNYGHIWRNNEAISFETWKNNMSKLGTFTIL